MCSTDQIEKSLATGEPPLHEVRDILDHAENTDEQGFPLTYPAEQPRCGELSAVIGAIGIMLDALQHHASATAPVQCGHAIRCGEQAIRICEQLRLLEVTDCG